MKSKIGWFILLFCIYGHAQNDISLKFKDSVAMDFTSFLGSDNFETYYFKNNNALIKQNTSQKLQYKNVSLGTIESICLTNPLQLVVFYKDFNSLILLDNQLNETLKMDGNLLETPLKIEAFGLASQNKLWIYDDFLQKINLFDLKTNEIKVISTPLNSKIKNYSSDYNYFYWVDEKYNFYSISFFGTIKNLGVVPAYDKIQIMNANKILYSKDNTLFYFDIEKKENLKIEKVINSSDNFFCNNKNLSIFTNNQIINYLIELP